MIEGAKFKERRRPANAELRAAVDALELWVRHAELRKSGVIKVTHHELVTMRDALILALRDDNPQSLLVVDEGENPNDEPDGF